VGHGVTCGVCELGLDWQGGVQGDGVISLLVHRENSWKPAFVIRTAPCNDSYLPTE
jgi:hypothetical protein